MTNQHPEPEPEVVWDKALNNGVNCPGCGARLPSDYDNPCPDCGASDVGLDNVKPVDMERVAELKNDSLEMLHEAMRILSNIMVVTTTSQRGEHDEQAYLNLMVGYNHFIGNPDLL